MSKILVTGATGQLGGAVIDALLSRVDIARVVALVRDELKAGDLIAKGVEVRVADYFDPSALRSAFADIDTIYLVSAVAFTDRLAQHRNVISAARQTGVRRLFYTSIQRVDDALAPIDGVTDSDIATEHLLRASGLSYTILKHPLYAEELPKFLGAALQGFAVPAGEGRIALTSRKELAEGAAVLLSGDGHANLEYTLNAGQTYSFQELADALSRLSGHQVRYADVTAEAFIDARITAGWPPAAARFVEAWFHAMKQGAFDEASPSLERLLGRKPKGLEEILQDAFLS
nr:SDR family oxidoreductase [uncultured Pseudomonas sp.]